MTVLEVLWRADQQKLPTEADVECLEKLITEHEAVLGGEKTHAALMALARLKGKALGFKTVDSKKLRSSAACLSSIPTDEWLTKRELAQWLKVTQRTIEIRVGEGNLPYVKLGGLCRFYRNDILKALRQTTRFKPLLD